MKTNFRNNNFALSLAFIMNFKATRKWLNGNAKTVLERSQVRLPLGELGFFVYSFLKFHLEAQYFSSSLSR